MNIQDWCADGPGRYEVDKPWTIDNVSYATDGYRMIAITDGSAGVHEIGDRRLPKITGDFFGLEAAKDWQQLPTLEDCDECDNTGEIVMPAGYCDKCILGTIECPTCGHEDECESCYGSGKVQEKKERCCTVMLGKVNIQRRYANLLIDLPGIEWCDTTSNEKPHGVGGERITFRFLGGYGAIMGASE